MSGPALMDAQQCLGWVLAFGQEDKKRLHAARQRIKDLEAELAETIRKKEESLKVVEDLSVKLRTEKENSVKAVEEERVKVADAMKETDAVKVQLKELKQRTWWRI
ncbi:uncharacterized protein [Rutidosis leptorrhynchoides]|uniref:uncharacterized protein n=1 Tax=Rutidosis leptorrhynchoides TaxID=125765 RepID=UPI003A98EB60